MKTHQRSFPLVQNGGNLVHADFKPVNLLWDDKEGVTVLDWEFAHSGHPILDFGILLRHENDFPLDISFLERGYLENGGKLPSSWIKSALITDFVNILDLLNRPSERPKLFSGLVSQLETTMKRFRV